MFPELRGPRTGLGTPPLAASSSPQTQLIDRPGLTRRGFLKAGTAAALTAASWNRVMGANERVGIGIIGFGLVGRIHTRNFKAQPDAHVVGVAETYQPRLAAAAALVGGNVARYGDFRRLLENKAVDAVVVATPDHWHALLTMLACAAGKDVYVEKPLTLFVREGRWMVEVARRHRRVVQVGTQQRSGPHYQRARELIQAGRLGQLVSVQCNFFRNVSPGFGNPPDQAAPPDLDYDLWLGPAPRRPYNPNRALYHFRWFWDYSGGQMTNLGAHSLDTVHWCTGVKGPVAVASAGGRFFLKDNCEVPDVQDAIIEYPGFQTVCQFRECAAGPTQTGMGGVVFSGNHGTMLLGRQGYELVADRKENPTNIVARIIGGHPIGGPQPVPERKVESWTRPARDQSGDWKAQYVLHVRNFLDCVKSRREPNSDLESAHRVATVCHLANLSLRTGRKLRWDAEREEIPGDPEASVMLARPYRAPWDAELKALGVG
ncbi:MAG: Gfo/Idh/MocA family oxidoreductase [Verrucomicrobia bacterium]|nr:Gfo/Idh/MocA family oxidoreductase [Verrucomicrobiota bacterium]